MTTTTIADTGSELARLFACARDEGLAAGLRSILAGGVAAPCSPGGHTLVPADSLGEITQWRLDGRDRSADQVAVRVLEHPLAATEGLVLVQASTTAPGEATGADPERPLAAVRLGLISHLLQAGVRHLADRRVEGQPLTHKQLVQAGIAEAATEVELCRATLRRTAPAPVVRALHGRLNEIGWLITTWFGGSGYVRDHPVRSLYVAELVADAWVGV